MPYTLHKRSYFNVLRCKLFYRCSALRECLMALSSVDYSVVESRRDGHAALLTFLESGVAGEEIFGRNNRFGIDQDEIFLTDADAQLQRITSGLQSTLTWRPTNVAKDVEAGRTTGRASDANNGSKEILEQGSQDNVKRFEEMLRLLKVYTNSMDHIWDRENFEMRVAAVWTEPAAAAPAPGPAPGPAGAGAGP
jgi:hypothetical protein